MDRLAELTKLKAEAEDRIDAVLATAKTEGRDEDHLTEEEYAAIEKDTTAAEKFVVEMNAIQKRRDLIRRRAEIDESPAPASTPKPNAGPIATGGPAFEKDEKKWGWKSYAEFLTAVRFAAVNNGINMDERLRAKMATGMSRLTGGDGGFLTPPTFEATIWDGVMEKTEVNLISMCAQRTVMGKSVTINASNETSRADGSRFGGARGYWISEGGTLQASKPTFRQLTLAPHKLACLYYATDELLEDSNALQQELEQVAGKEIRYVANRAIVRGTGSGQPKGILQGTAGTTSPRIAVTVETGQTSATPLVAENIDKMWSRLSGEARPGAVWLINQELEPHLQAIGREVGTAGIPAYMPPGGLSSTPYGTLKGRPVVTCEWCSAANTEGDIILANMQGYVVGTKGGVRSDSSIHVQFTTDEVAFRFIFRIDGQPWRLVPTTMEFGSTFTVSEFVTLATRS